MGLEIAPFHSPIAPKRDGWNCKILDYYDTVKLQEIARLDPDPYVSKNITNIENVDIIASASDLEQELYKIGMLGRFDYLCSSHNFEHLPDPLKFLRGAGMALKKDGFLSMAIPNKIHTFDFARPLTSTKDFLKFYFEKQLNPDPYTLFDLNSSFVQKINGEFRYKNDLKQSYDELLKNINRKEYIDAHVTIYTPESFINILNDLMILNLIPFEINEIKVTGIEFIVHMQNVGHDFIGKSEERFQSRRHLLLKKLNKK